MSSAGVASIIEAECWLNKLLQIPKSKQGAYMAKLECNYFPDTPASWLCDHCHVQYSERCIPAGHSPQWGRRGPCCILCSSELRYLGSATGAKPFWQMLPHFFRYPLHPNSLLVIAGLALGSLL